MAKHTCEGCVHGEPVKQYDVVNLIGMGGMGGMKITPEPEIHRTCLTTQEVVGEKKEEFVAPPGECVNPNEFIKNK